MTHRSATAKKSPTTIRVADVIFRIRCRGLPSDHAHELRAALSETLPWLNDTKNIALLPVRGAASGNGWQRPSGENDFIHLSRHAFFGLRVPGERIAQTQQLIGKRLNIRGEALTITHSNTRPLLCHATLSSRHLALPHVDDEKMFLTAAAECLRALDVDSRKIIGGQRTTVRTARGRIPVRNLMVSDLTPKASMRLQETGIGDLLMWGCGVFLPHKGVAPLRQEQSM